MPVGWASRLHPSRRVDSFIVPSRPFAPVPRDLPLRSDKSESTDDLAISLTTGRRIRFFPTSPFFLCRVPTGVPVSRYTARSLLDGGIGIVSESGDRPPELNQLYADHRRDATERLYVYAVVSRRSRGVSIGINLNPDFACNFDCVYCCVDRSRQPRIRQVDLGVLKRELDTVLSRAVDGSMFEVEPFCHTPPALRRVNDIAFSGDGEPTACPQFLEAVQLAAAARQQYGLDATKLVVITDACYFDRPAVRQALPILDANNGEIWAKLDAGTEAYFRQVNRPNVPLSHVLDNILAVARDREIVLQSIFMNIDGAGPTDEEMLAFADRINDLVTSGARIARVQMYTTARWTAERYVTPLSAAQLDHCVDLVRKRIEVDVETFYGVDA